MEVVNALGRRKSAVARVFVSEGTRETLHSTFHQLFCSM
jgi:ribosomal protein S9